MHSRTNSHNRQKYPYRKNRNAEDRNYGYRRDDDYSNRGNNDRNYGGDFNSENQHHNYGQGGRGMSYSKKAYGRNIENYLDRGNYERNYRDVREHWHAMGDMNDRDYADYYSRDYNRDNSRRWSGPEYVEFDGRYSPEGYYDNSNNYRRYYETRRYPTSRWEAEAENRRGRNRGFDDVRNYSSARNNYKRYNGWRKAVRSNSPRFGFRRPHERF